MQSIVPVCCFALLACSEVAQSAAADVGPHRPRARDIGLVVGILPTGPLNAITDVPGVEVGQTTVIRGEDVRTGVTVVLPHGGNLFKDKVPGAVYVGNGFGKLVGSTEVEELGEIESPIALTSTLSIGRVADALIEYMLAIPENRDVRSINPVVGETNDRRLNDVRSRPVEKRDVFAAIEGAKGGPVDEGSVGAGTGSVAFGFKGGIGTSSRRLPAALGGYTVGVLVQSNFGGILTIDGAPVGRELGRYYLKEILTGDQQGAVASDATAARGEEFAGGSIMMVVATDAPVDHRNLKRMGFRALMGLARTGSSGSTDSGDYVVAFSVAPALMIHSDARLHPSENVPLIQPTTPQPLLPNDSMSPLFLAVIEATEEAIYNSIFRATSMTGNGNTVEALPIDKTVKVLCRHRLLEGPVTSGSSCPQSDRARSR